MTIRTLALPARATQLAERLFGCAPITFQELVAIDIDDPVRERARQALTLATILSHETRFATSLRPGVSRYADPLQQLLVSQGLSISSYPSADADGYLDCAELIADALDGEAAKRSISRAEGRQPYYEQHTSRWVFRLDMRGYVDGMDNRRFLELYTQRLAAAGLIEPELAIDDRDGFHFYVRTTTKAGGQEALAAARALELELIAQLGMELTA